MSVLIPAYNEAAIIERTLSTVRDHLSTRPDAHSWEMLVVDDGSTDGTGDLAEAFAAGDERIRVLRHRTNFGLGQALRYGFAQAKGDVVVTLDADLTYSVDHVDRLLDAFEQTGAKIVVASPYAHGGVTTRVPFRRLLPSRVANVLLAAASNAHISTYTGMVRAYDTRF
ncbi:MAG TPA: glycosyltransferase family 2 protein, partial [Candidatus Elarobacter sp.]